MQVSLSGNNNVVIAELYLVRRPVQMVNDASVTSLYVGVCSDLHIQTRQKNRQSCGSSS